MRRQMLYVTAPICVAVVIAGTWLVEAGPLTPPPGIVASTGRFGPRTEITALPFPITAPGSYYLGSSLAGVPGADGITISADDVDIDLGGFEIVGGPGSLPGISILPLPVSGNVTIHDGQVRDWGSDGITLGMGAGNAHIYNVSSVGNVGAGVISGIQSIVRNVIANGNGTTGIDVINDSKLTNCVAVSNGADGIVTGFGSHVSDSVAGSNGGVGFSLTGPNCVLIGSVADLNGGDGIVAGGGCRIVDTLAAGNGTAALGSGILLTGANNSIEGCIMEGNVDGGVDTIGLIGSNSAHDCIADGNGSGFVGVQRLTDCSANGNVLDGFFTGDAVVANCVAKFNGGDGFFVTFSHLSDCTAGSNGDDGIDATQSRIRDCNSDANVSDGIEGSFGNFITGNNCTGGMANGILITGDFNAIENNHVIANALAGVDTAIASGMGFPTNTILSNRATGNLIDYDLDFLGNTYGAVFAGPGVVPAGSNTNISY